MKQKLCRLLRGFCRADDSNPIIAELLREEGTEPTGSAIDLEQLRLNYLGYKQAYRTMQKEARASGAIRPLNRSDDELSALRGKPSILIVSLPHSGAQYLGALLATKLGYNKQRVPWIGEFPKNVVRSWMAQEFSQGGIVGVGPLQYDPFNLRQLRHYRLTKLVLYARDPRAATYNRMRSPPSDLDLLSKLKPTPQSPLSFGSGDRLDFFIQEFFMDSLDWLNKWTEVLDSDSYELEILVVRNEDLVKDKQSVLRSILDFYEIDAGDFPPVKIEPIPESLPADEWRNAIDPARLERMTQLMPKRLFERFGWTP